MLCHCTTCAHADINISNNLLTPCHTAEVLHCKVTKWIHSPRDVFARSLVTGLKLITQISRPSRLPCPQTDSYLNSAGVPFVFSGPWLTRCHLAKKSSNLHQARVKYCKVTRVQCEASQLLKTNKCKTKVQKTQNLILEINIFFLSFAGKMKSQDECRYCRFHYVTRSLILLIRVDLSSSTLIFFVRQLNHHAAKSTTSSACFHLSF